MTAEQIEKYEYCKKDLKQIKEWKNRLPFSDQNHGCGSLQPSIEHVLERVHENMYKGVMDAITKAEKVIQVILDEI